METKVGRIKLGPQGQEISEQGLGCSSMSAFYGPPKREPDMINLIHHAINSGVTFLDTFDVYGPHTNDILLGKALKDIRDRIELATKFGACTVDGRREFRGDPAYVREACEGGLKRLGVENIDLYYQHRVDTRFPSKSREACSCLLHGSNLKILGITNTSLSGLMRWQGEKGAAPSQLALAWIHHQGDGMMSAQIPGTIKTENLNENIRALSVKLTPEEMAEIESIASADAVKGDRYGDTAPTYKNSDTPPFIVMDTCMRECVV
ncbi:NADP-dependent oxidoreductase domain - like 10 [Theobroma cacao]|nr:NADP-dependent oxidoreductase domain - like 10 [Theobroma cacao]